LSPWAIIGLQVATTLAMAVVWSVFANPQELRLCFFSALLGGFIGFFPATLFALRLSVSRRQKNQNPGSLLAAVVSGEFLKIVVTIALFVWVALSIPDLQWIPLLITYLVTLKCYLLAWLWR
jgi:ATP synthase protein I